MNLETELIEMHAIIHGQVQGVGFRATTFHFAHQLSLKGTVKNLPDGSVEIYAQGNRKALEKLMQNLKDLMHSHIQRVELSFSPPKNALESFRILSHWE